MSDDFIKDILNNERSEQAIIGTILMEPTHLPMLQGAGLVRDMFTDAFRRMLFDTILQLQEGGFDFDLAIVSDAMRRRHPDMTVTDDHKIDECVDVSMPSMALEYLFHIKEVYKLKQVEAVLRGAAKRLAADDQGPDVIISTIKHELSLVTSGTDNVRTKEEVCKDILAQMKNAKTHGSAGIVSRFMTVQRKLAGYRHGKSTIIAARPKCGKTTFMCNECEYSADVLKEATGIISIEMKQEELWTKIAAGKSEVDTNKLDNGDATAIEEARFQEALKYVMALDLTIIDSASTIEQVCSAMRMMASEGARRVAIDYLQLISPSSSTKTKSRNQEVAHWSNMITNTAKELDVQVLLLSQLNRTSVQDKEKPQLHHLRDSGAIEQDAAAILFISEHPDNPSFTMDRKVIVDIAANRFGPVGEVEMVFCPYIQKFRSTEFEGSQKQEAKGRRF